VTAGKLGLNRTIFEQEKQQAEAEANEQQLRVATNVKLSYIQALAAQQTLELRQGLSKLAQDAVETSHQLANVGQADAPDVLEAEVESQQADLAVNDGRTESAARLEGTRGSRWQSQHNRALFLRLFWGNMSVIGIITTGNVWSRHQMDDSQ
jgi:hypothetical protein